MINRINIIQVLIAIGFICICLSCNSIKNTDNKINVISYYTVKDYFGREIQFDKPSNRIIPLYYGECEIITAIGAKNRIIGVGLLPNKNNSSSFILNRFFPQIYSLPKVGSGSLNIERLFELKPDLIIIDNRVSILNQLEKYNLKSLAIFPKKLNDLLVSIDVLGNITNKKKNSEILVDSLTKLLNIIKNKTSLLIEKEIPKVYYLWSDLLTTVNDSVQNEIFEICGGVNVLKNEFPPAFSLTVSLENLYKWNPDFIIIRDRSNLTVDDIMNNKKLQYLKAIHNKNVFKEHMGWRGYKIESFFGIIEKSKWFHPDLFSDINAESEYQKFMKLIELFNK